jgi:hypothetical protein
MTRPTPTLTVTRAQVHQAAQALNIPTGHLTPAGFAGPGGTVVRGTVAADSECSVCGEPVCSTCLDGGDVCPDCAEWDEDVDEVV